MMYRPERPHDRQHYVDPDGTQYIYEASLHQWQDATLSLQVLTALNRAFAADPTAMYCLTVNRVPCNDALADDPTIVVDKHLVAGTPRWAVGLMGIINGILGEMGIPLIASRFSDNPVANGHHAFEGFGLYIQKGTTDGSC